ncbi:ribose-5-phosphate isomerase RpiA [Hymenobacter taeanensis]|uniref:Ribose-5-phosphate isomerase A n=1 Tax=Hymenobacter taeanensis TaxID=2735321 RepID=A0A6M6BP15_9BACT|nr:MULTISPECIES: ribose-5-phosphate isomerase RpiA [Hymenobacter]QJX48775.1 ribose-5-phosphate isomerase RpiA [Hymenobacter taeanensis]UOQ81721.1 ribose-5-phosphate isomerase RpiA [Hymenobacter sp. 5414T-23]
MLPSAPHPNQLDQEKKLAAAAALRWVQDGMVLGLGTGSTAAHFISLLGEAVRNGQLRVQATATSQASEAQARELGIPLLQPRRGLRFDLTIDGADELDPQLRLIKGGGGALLREKVLANASDYLLIIADSTKLVPQLGQFPLPLEVVPFALPWVLDAVAELGGAPVLRPDRRNPQEPARSDQGNLLVDCHFNQIPDPAQVAAQLKTIPGLVEHGLFLGLARAALVVQSEQVMAVRPGIGPVPATSFTQLP